MPTDSAAHRAMVGHNWTHDRDWLTADIRDAIATLAAMFGNVNRAEGSPAVPMPPMAPRPGQADRAAANEKRERAAHDRMRAQLLGR